MIREVITDENLIAKFIGFVKQGNDPNDCWEWTGSSRFGNPYGYFFIKGEGSRPAPEVSHRIFVGPIPDGHEMRHTRPCKCVNWRHLSTGTKEQNIQDKIDQGTVARGAKCRTTNLTEDNVRYIRASSKSNKELAIELKVAYDTIRHARRGISWAWLK